MSVKELKSTAAKAGIELPAGVEKGELIRFLSEALMFKVGGVDDQGRRR